MALTDFCLFVIHSSFKNPFLIFFDTDVEQRNCCITFFLEKTPSFTSTRKRDPYLNHYFFGD